MSYNPKRMLYQLEKVDIFMINGIDASDQKTNARFVFGDLENP